MRLKVPTKIGPCYPRCTPTYGTGGRGSRSHRLVSGLLPGAPPASNGLLNNLIAYWPGDEVAGNALDAHTNALHLTDINTVTSNPGNVYLLARQYTRANVEYHRHIDDPLLSCGNTDITWAAWVYLGSKPGTQMRIMAKHDGASIAGSEYALSWINTTDRFRLEGYLSPATTPTVSATTFGAPALGTWYLVIAHHDAVNDQLGISVNDGVIDTAALVGGLNDTVTVFNIGNWANNGAGTNCWDGRIGPSAMWKSAAGGGGVLTAAQRTALYNGGAGLTYAELTA